MRKILFSAALMLLAVSPLLSMPPDTLRNYSFTYDGSGNRILREAVIIQLKSAATFPATFTDKQAQVFEEKLSNHAIFIYPNPTGGLLNISLPDIENGEARVMVYNTQGRLILEKRIEGPQGEINLSTQPSGIYFMKITIGEMSAEWKVVKE